MRVKTAKPQKKSSFTAIDIHLSRSNSNASSSSSSSSSSLDELATKKRSTDDAFDVKAYLDSRVMTPLQEACNAISMFPQIVYCIYYVLSGSWATGASVDAYYANTSIMQQASDWLSQIFGYENSWTENLGCLNYPMFPNLTALPPPAVLMLALAGVVHPMVSMLFHWYCMELEPSKRVPHWSRRLDHASIHFGAALASYGTTGSFGYFLLNCAFNLDCALKQFEPKISPKRNLRRVGMAILLYTTPVLLRGHYLLYCQFLVLFILAGYSFAKYPIGGWSHTLFHLFLSFLPCLLFRAAVQLDSSQAQINLAAQCASGTV